MKSKYIFLPAIMVIFVLAIITIFIGNRASKHLSEQLPEQSAVPGSTPAADVSANASSLFGTMLAFNINDAASNMTAELQKGWTEFRKNNSAYQNFKSNLEKIIQDRAKLVKATGFSLDRELVPYFTWNVIEPQKGQFDWDLTDIYAQAASNAGVKISAVIQPFAGWDQKTTPPLAGCNALDFAYYDYKVGPPNDLGEYENFLTKTAERYKNRVAVWEIGNEYDGPCGGYQNNPQGYFDLVKITSETIKKVDSKAIVTNGGASEMAGAGPGTDSTKNFWQQFFALGGSRYIDYFNFHYNTERSQGAKLDTATFQETLAFLNNLMDKNGGKKPLYLTEFGIYSGSPSSQPPGQSTQGSSQGRTNLPTRPVVPPEQSPNQPPENGKCGDGICDDFEKQNPSACPQDCGTGGQQARKPASNQNLPNESQSFQAALYFKDSIIAFAGGVRTIFIDLVGPDDSLVGSSMAFNTGNQPRLFLATLKTVENKINGFSQSEKIADSQYKFTVGGKTVYALWSGTLPKEISGQTKVTDAKGQEQIMDAAGIKLKADQPVFVELSGQD